MLNQNEEYNALVISATTTVKTGSGQTGGVFVSAASGSPTITVYDNTSASGTTLVSVFTPVASTAYAFPCHFSTGLTVAVSGTVSCTVFYA